MIDEKVSDFTFSDIRNPPTPWKQFMLTLILEELVLESKEEQDIDQRFSKTRHFKTTIFSLSFLFIDLLQITFVIDGVVDIKRRVCIPVSIVYTRSKNVHEIDPTLFRTVYQFEHTCQTAHLGVSKVFVTSNGQCHMMYTEYVTTDNSNRQPVYTTTMPEGVNPDYDGGDALYKA